VKDSTGYLPNDASIKNIQYHLNMCWENSPWQADIRNGNHHSSEEAKERLNKWMNS